MNRLPLFEDFVNEGKVTSTKINDLLGKIANKRGIAFDAVGFEGVGGPFAIQFINDDPEDVKAVTDALKKLGLKHKVIIKEFEWEEEEWYEMWNVKKAKIIINKYNGEPVHIEIPEDQVKFTVK